MNRIGRVSFTEINNKKVESAEQDDYSYVPADLALHFLQDKLFNTQSRLLTTLKKKALENTAGKGENAGNQHFLLLPQCFLLYQREILKF